MFLVAAPMCLQHPNGVTLLTVIISSMLLIGSVKFFYFRKINDRRRWVALEEIKSSLRKIFVFANSINYTFIFNVVSVSRYCRYISCDDDINEKNVLYSSIHNTS